MQLAAARASPVRAGSCTLAVRAAAFSPSGALLLFADYTVTASLSAAHTREEVESLAAGLAQCLPS